MMFLGALLLSGVLSAGTLAPLTTVASVDIERYAGTWYEIARFPNFFQKGCDSAVAKYTLLPQGGLEVLNSCRKPDGSTKSVLGRAKIVDSQSNAKLKVSFVPAWLRWTGVGWGDYWIIDLAPDYSFAVVSEPQREYLWILNREPAMAKAVYDKILKDLVARGFDVARLIRSGPDTVKDR